VNLTGFSGLGGGTAPAGAGARVSAVVSADAACQYTAAPRRPGAGPLLILVNGVLADVGSVYVGTHSVLITVIAGVTAILLAAMVMFPRW
jgi:hypothetical protein